MACSSSAGRTHQLPCLQDQHRRPPTSRPRCASVWLRAGPVGARVEPLQHGRRHHPHLAGALAGDDVALMSSLRAHSPVPVGLLSTAPRASFFSSSRPGRPGRRSCGRSRGRCPWAWAYSPVHSLRAQQRLGAVEVGLAHADHDGAFAAPCPAPPSRPAARDRSRGARCRRRAPSRWCRAAGRSARSPDSPAGSSAYRAGCCPAGRRGEVCSSITLNEPGGSPRGVTSCLPVGIGGGDEADRRQRDEPARCASMRPMSLAAASGSPAA